MPGRTRSPDRDAAAIGSSRTSIGWHWLQRYLKMVPKDCQKFATFVTFNAKKAPQPPHEMAEKISTKEEPGGLASVGAAEDDDVAAATTNLPDQEQSARPGLITPVCQPALWTSCPVWPGAG